MKYRLGVLHRASSIVIPAERVPALCPSEAACGKNALYLWHPSADDPCKDIPTTVFARKSYGRFKFQKAPLSNNLAAEVLA